ncbi:MAG: hypothetical protein ACR2QH_11030 [Geminicoccaceae bacterium]
MANGLDLSNFLARNRQAGGLNATLAEALAGNLEPRPQALAPTPVVSPGLFGIGNTPGDRGDLGGGFKGGGSLLNLATFLAGPVTAVPSLIGGLVANDALGNLPSTSLFGAARSLFDGTAGTRALSSSEARAIQRAAEREDRRANRDFREGRGSGASPRRGDVSNAGR